MKTLEELLGKYKGEIITDALIQKVADDARAAVTEAGIAQSESGEKEAVVSKAVDPKPKKRKFKAIVSVPDPIAGRAPEEGEQTSFPIALTEPDE